MRDSQVDAFARALAYIVKCLPPPKRGDEAKRERTAVLQALQNARRQSQTDAAESHRPRAGSAAGNEAQSEPSEPAAPSDLSVNIVMPLGADRPQTAPGTTAGESFKPRTAEATDGDK